MKYKQIKTREVVEQVEAMAQLARVGQDWLEALSLLSPETRRAIIHELAERGGTHLVASWPTSAIRDLREAREGSDDILSNLMFVTKWSLDRLTNEWGDEGVLIQCLEAVINKAEGREYDPDAIGPWNLESGE